jgi:hypothetical protein
MVILLQEPVGVDRRFRCKKADQNGRKIAFSSLREKKNSECRDEDVIPEGRGENDEKSK